MWAIQDGNRTWSIPSTETSDSILPNSESRISLTSLYHHSDSRTLWNLFGLCFNNCPDSWIIEQSSKTRILILNPRDDNSYTTLNRLSTHSTFPQLFGTCVTWHQMSARSKGSVHLFMETYLTSCCFCIQVDLLLYKCNDFFLLVWRYITPEKHVHKIMSCLDIDGQHNQTPGRNLQDSAVNPDEGRARLLLTKLTMWV